MNDNQKILFNEICLVKRRIRLVEGERKANSEENEEEIKKNERRIEDLRNRISEVKKQLVIVRNSNCDYLSVLIPILGEKDCIPFRSKTVGQAKEIIEGWIGDLKNKINLARYEKKQFRNKLSNLLLEKEQYELNLYGCKNNKIQSPLTELHQAENDVASMEMRITEAENVQAKYKMIMQALRQDTYKKEVEMRELEKAMKANSKDEAHLRRAVSTALRVRKVSHLKLAEIESRTMKDVLEREGILQSIRAQLKSTREATDEIGAKLNTLPKLQLAHRDSSSLAEGLQFLESCSSGIYDKPRDETAVERVYRHLAEMTGESDPAEIVCRFLDLRKRATELQTAEKEKKSQLRKEKLRKQFLEDKLAQLQYSGGIKREILNQQISELDEEIEAMEFKKAEGQKRVAELSDILNECLTRLRKLCTKTNIDIQLNIEEMNSVGEQVKAILKTVQELVHEKIQSDTLRYQILIPPPLQRLETLGSSIVMSTDEAITKKKGLFLQPRSRPVTGKSSTESPGFEDQVRGESKVVGGNGGRRQYVTESSEEEEALSRSLVKRQSQNLVEAKVRKARFKALSSPINTSAPRH